MTESPSAETGRYTESTPKSRELQGEAERFLPGGSSRGTAYFEPYPFFVDRGEGHYVYDVDGNRYLDLHAERDEPDHGPCPPGRHPGDP